MGLRSQRVDGSNVVEVLNVCSEWGGLVDAAHAVDRDFLDQQLLFDECVFGDCFGGLRVVLRIHWVPPNVGLVPVQQMRVELDSNARRSSQGTALFGGSPFRLMRLSERGARMLDAWVAGEPVEDSAEALQLQQRLLAAGLLHPIVDPVMRDDVGFVVPVFEDPVGLEATLVAIRSEFPAAPVVVVDDASADVESHREIAGRQGTDMIAHSVNQGPGAARNTGESALPDDVSLVVFVDSDVVPGPDCVSLLLAHFDEAAIVAVAPRIRAQAGESLLDRYEAAESPLDLGGHAAIVRPGSPVPYVPSTVLAVRRSALQMVQGFDEAMRLGEDVDLIWRLLSDGGFVRYEPAAEAQHRNRSSWGALARQRHGYGTAAASLDRRHPGNVAPIELPAKTLMAWTLACVGGAPGVVVAALSVARDVNTLRVRLGDRVDEPVTETLRLSALGHAHAGHWLARAVTRAWLPAVVIGAGVSSTARRVLVVSAVLPNAVTWLRQRPALNPLAYVAARVVDDVAYCSGVWRGAVRERSLRSLLPRTAPR